MSNIRRRLTLGLVAIALGGGRAWTAQMARQGGLHDGDRAFPVITGLILAYGPQHSFTPELGPAARPVGSQLAAGPLQLRNQLAVESVPTITVLVYDYAHRQGNVTGSAERVVAAIFRNAGVKSVWVDCPLPPARAKSHSACGKALGETDFVVKILTQSMAEKLSAAVEGDPLGFAIPCRNPEHGCLLYIMYQRILDVVDSSMGHQLILGRFGRDRVLGHVIAHELGHLLLGPKAHSSTGIMQGKWLFNDLVRITWGAYLLFTPSQAKLVRSQVIQRQTKVARSSDSVQKNE